VLNQDFSNTAPSLLIVLNEAMSKPKEQVDLAIVRWMFQIAAQSAIFSALGTSRRGSRVNGKRNRCPRTP